jgi:uncharacterized protein (DUF2236 family)
VPLSVTQRINAERLVILGWSRAILMQLAHPLIAAGVLHHSSFRGDVVQAAVRLHHTVRAMLALTFGDEPQRETVLSRIRGIHRIVNGTLAGAVGPFPPGTRYSAEDPALLLWVHATLADSSADIYQRVIGPLAEGELDAFCEESARVLHELGGDPATTPRTWRAMRGYISAVQNSGALVVADDTRALGRAVLAPHAGGLPLPLTGLQRLVTVGLLPASIRDAYGFDWDARHDAKLTRTLGRLRRLRRVMPAALAQWPQARRLRRA